MAEVRWGCPRRGLFIKHAPVGAPCPPFYKPEESVELSEPPLRCQGRGKSPKGPPWRTCQQLGPFRGPRD